MGRVGKVTECTLVSISIHPSRVGWDHNTDAVRAQVRDFNPPIPCGMGLAISIGRPWRWIFQSTHPVWDGTNHPEPRGQNERDFNPPIPCGMGPAGTHAPQRYRANFNPPIPCGMGQGVALYFCVLFMNFNPPIPCGMGLLLYSALALRRRISIHPSRVGWDRIARYAGYSV